MADPARAWTSIASQVDRFVHGGPINQWVLFLVLLVLSYVLARLASRHVVTRFMRSRRVETAVVELVGRLFVVMLLLLSTFTFSSIIFGANVAAALTTIGLVSLALGFGLQNTIANIAGGISLALDRPFRIGDQIQVRDVVGDVQEIGIRSTRILTRRKEFVVVPNKVLEEEFIWNYTMVYPDLRLDVPVSIAYDSDREVAEELMLGVAFAHPVVLRDPTPRVLLRQFGASSLDLEMRCWIAHPRNREVVLSDLLKGVQDRFDAEGIEIPYPHRTIVQKVDGAGARKRSERVRRADPSKSVRRLLVPLPETMPDPAGVEYVIKLAKALNAQVIAAYVAQPGNPHAGEDSGRALYALDREAAMQGLWYKPLLLKDSQPVNAVAEAAKAEDIDVVVLGVERPRHVLEWGRFHDAPRLPKAEVEALVPDVIIHEAPGGSSVSARTVATLQEQIQARRGRAQASHLPPVQVSKPEPATSAVPSQPAEGPRQKPEEKPVERASK